MALLFWGLPSLTNGEAQPQFFPVVCPPPPLEHGVVSLGRSPEGSG